MTILPTHALCLARAARVATLTGLAMLGLLPLAGCNASRPALPAAETPQQISAQIDKAASLVRDAQRLENIGSDRQAADKYREAIGVYRELPVAWNNLGRLMMRDSNNLAAAEAFKTAAELSPTDPRPVHNLGTLWESLGYMDDAARWYGEALSRDDSYLPSLRRVAIVEEIRNKPDSTTLERIRRALLIEQDPWWRDKFRRDKLRFEDLINTAKTDPMSKVDPIYRPEAGAPRYPGNPPTIPPAPAPQPRPQPIPNP